MLLSITSVLAAALLAPVPASTTQADASAQDPPIPDCGKMQILPSGLKFCVLKEGGDAEFPKIGDLVRVDYTGWNLDGTVFDSSRRPRRPGLDVVPAEFAVGGLIDGWNEALQLMSPGDQWKIYVPSAIGYGETGSAPDIAPNADLIFELELHAILDRAPRFAPWDDAEEGKTTYGSGAMLRALEAGEGKPASESELAVVRFACYNPGGGLAFAHTSRGQERLMLTQDRRPLAFFSDVMPLLKPGARLQVNVPSHLGIGGPSQNPIRNLPDGSNEIWMLECERTMTGVKPDFRMPTAEELTTTESGLQYVILREGDGRRPTAKDTVRAFYTGWLTDGSEFDSSFRRGGPSQFALSGPRRVIDGWTEGLQLLREGGSALFVIPGDLAYGEKGRVGIPPNSTLVFHIELVVF
ncbi:MAG: FKBP-type peptidyl-prolyl cis-trans isomerase [Planctomycetota bacterium]